MKIVLISYTPASWSGGVNRWTNDFLQGFPDAVHFSWWDALSAYGGVDQTMSETDRARLLNQYLIWSKKISKDDIIIVDGFWGTGLEAFPNVVSVCHGIWSHLTMDDVLAKKKPEFEYNHLKQVAYRTAHVARGGRMIAVSDFISNQLKLQWGWDVPVINNAIDLEKYKPIAKIDRNKPLVIHGVNDKTNANKGWEHIERLSRDICTVKSLDEAEVDMPLELRSKPQALAQADLVVIPSGYEGNSYFCLEALACDVPILAYDVGLPYAHMNNLYGAMNDPVLIGRILDRKKRSPEFTAENVVELLDDLAYWKDRNTIYRPRRWVEQFSIKNFHEQWKKYLKEQFSWES